MFIVNTVMTAFIGGIITLDRTAAFQIMVSRPLVASTIVGLFLGDVNTGLTIGILLELLWLGYLPVGASLTPNETAIAVVATGVTLFSGNFLKDISNELMVFVLLVSLPIGWIFKEIDKYIRVFNSRISMKTLAEVEQKGDRAINLATLKGLGLFFTPNFIFLLFFIIVDTFLVVQTYPALGPRIMELLRILFYIIPLVGISVVINSLTTIKRPLLWFIIIFLLIIATAIVIGKV